MKQVIRVEVCYATPEKQVLLALQIDAHASVADAISASKIVEMYPEIDLRKNHVGIFGKLTKLETLLRDEDRVEIYRALIADPKEARRKRAAKKLSR